MAQPLKRDRLLCLSSSCFVTNIPAHTWVQEVLKTVTDPRTAPDAASPPEAEALSGVHVSSEGVAPSGHVTQRWYWLLSKRKVNSVVRETSPAWLVSTGSSASRSVKRSTVAMNSWKSLVRVVLKTSHPSHTSPFRSSVLRVSRLSAPTDVRIVRRIPGSPAMAVEKSSTFQAMNSSVVANDSKRRPL